ncbi:MAG: hypothetical protein ACTSSN_07265 [Candidatus Heimdallarchaeaceae archaeon]
MPDFVIDTNFYISGFQTLPNTFSKFAKASKALKFEIYMTSYIKNEMRFFLQREITPHVKIVDVDHSEFQKFLHKVHKHTTSLPQKPDLSVIYLADKLSATIVSSDLKLLETAELIGIPTHTNSAFTKFILEENKDPTLNSFLKELENKLLTAEIRYSIESTNRYDPVKRIRKIIDSAISVIRSEYEEKMTQLAQSDLPETDGFSIESLQLKELLNEVQSDLQRLEDDFNSGKYMELEAELLARIREITDYLVDWKLAIDKIEDHIIYNESLQLLGRLHYLSCISLVENKKVDLARVYMDKLIMILIQNSEANEKYGIDVHFLRMIILLLSGQFQRLNSYFTPAFEDECNEYQRADVVNVIRALILLTVVLGGEKAVETAKDYDYDNIEFINQLGFKFMQLEDLQKAALMFEQTFYLSLNSKNRGLCIASLEYLGWLYFSGFHPAKSVIQNLYEILIKKFPEIKSSYQVSLQVTSKPRDLENFTSSSYQPLSALAIDLKSPLYCVGISYMKEKNKIKPLIKVMNWGMMARIGIIDENQELIRNSTLGNTIHLIDGKFKIVPASAHFRKQHDVELILHIDHESQPTILCRSPGGWELTTIADE